MNIKFRHIIAYLFLCSITLVFANTTSLNAHNKKPAKHPKRTEWSLVKMDSRWDSKEDLVSTNIIAKYKPSVDSLDIIVGTTAKELLKFKPESPLSNMAADIIRLRSDEYLAVHGGGNTDVSLFNFGGMRTVFKKGDISVADIFSVFPFNNRIVILEIKGKYIKQMLDDFAATERMEPLSGVKLVIEGKKVSTLLIGGKSVEDETVYKLATIDFILSGGDKIFVLKKAQNVIETDILIRDAVLDYFKKVTKNVKLIDSNTDGRVIVL